jgi:hypothetical protein
MSSRAVPGGGLFVIGLLILLGAGVVRYMDYSADQQAKERMAARAAKEAEEARLKEAEEKKLAAWRAWYQPPKHCVDDVAEGDFVACVNDKMMAKKSFDAAWAQGKMP